MKKFRKFEIITVTMFFSISMFVLNLVYAQDNILEIQSADQDFERTLSEKQTAESSEKEDEVNLPSPRTEDQIRKNVFEVAETVDEIRVDAEKTEDQLRDTVKTGIDRNIIEIRKTTDLPAYELQKAVDVDRLNLFESINNTLRNINVTNSDSLDNFINEVDGKIESIERSLEERSGEVIDLQKERRDVRNTLLRFQENIEEKKEIINKRAGDNVYKDTDNDGVSDYDEEFIYGTDPKNPSTAGDGESDSVKIASGRNPLTGQAINFADPRDDVDSYVTSAYRLEEVTLEKRPDSDVVKLRGRALPNSFVTLYIYSTPIIVTVKTDQNGDWNYELEKELENGEHQLYVATVNNSGKILARSNPITFTKTAEAASVGIVGIDVETSQAGDFFRDNFILISLAILVLIIVLSLMMVGRGKTVKNVVSDLKKEVEENNHSTKV
jgi:hypothetical protein